MATQTEIRNDVTARIIQALEADLLPWRRPWKKTGSASLVGTPTSPARSRIGLNPMLLEIHAVHHGFLSRWWGTFNQWHEPRLPGLPPTIPRRGRALGLPDGLLQAGDQDRRGHDRPATRTRSGSSSSGRSPSSPPTRLRGRRRTNSAC